MSVSLTFKSRWFTMGPTHADALLRSWSRMFRRAAARALNAHATYPSRFTASPQSIAFSIPKSTLRPSITPCSRLALCQSRFHSTNPLPAEGDAVAVADSTHSSRSADGFDVVERVAAKTFQSGVEPNVSLYVGNLYFSISESDLSKHMSQFGPVKGVRLVFDARGMSRG